MACIKNKGKGIFLIRISNGFVNGKRNTKSCTYHVPNNLTSRQQEAAVKRYASSLEYQLKMGFQFPRDKKRNVNNEDLTLQDFVENYYWKSAKKHLAPSTVAFYQMVISKIIIPSFGNVPLLQMDHRYLQKYVDALLEPGMRSDGSNQKPLSNATVKRYATVLRSIMMEAFYEGFIEDKNWQRGYVKYPKIVKKPIRPYSKEEAKTFVKGLKSEDAMHRLMLLSSLLLGIRCGELVALQWSDINYEANYIEITKSAYKVTDEPQQIKEPKSVSGVRRVYFGEFFLEVLNIWKNEQDQKRKENSWREQDYIFTNEIGGMIHVDTPSKYCSKYERKIGLRHLKLHGLRSTCGSLMMSAGVDNVTIKELLGHESLEATNIYLEAYESNKKDAATILQNIVC